MEGGGNNSYLIYRANGIAEARIGLWRLQFLTGSGKPESRCLMPVTWRPESESWTLESGFGRLGHVRLSEMLSS